MIIIYIRSLLRQLKIFSALYAITTLGLTIGFSCVILLSIWVNSELQFDGFYQKAARIYKVYIEEEVNGNSAKYAWVPFPLAKVLRNDIPEIENSTIVTGGSIKVKYNDLLFYENKTCFTEAGIFDVFDIEFIRGNKEKALAQKESIVITNKIAKKYFGDEDPIGKSIIVNDEYSFNISAIIKEIPENSSINYDLFILGEHFADPLIYNGVNWGALNFNSYVCLQESAKPDEVRGKIRDILIKYKPDKERYVNIQPIKQSHLYSVSGSPTNIKNILIMITLGIVICMVAVINFLNISLGQYHKRTKEFETKGILGSNKRQLALQIFSECSLIIIIATCLSVVLSITLFPIAENITGLYYSTNQLYESNIVIVIISLMVLALLIGVIPIIIYFIGSLKTGSARKDKSHSFQKPHNFVFITLQFAASILLIIGVLVVTKQLSFILDKDMGLDTSNVITLPLKGGDKERYEVLKEKLLKTSNVKQVTAAYNWPTQIGTSCGIESWPGNPYLERLEIKYTVVDKDYFSTMGMTMVKGVPFSEKLNSDSVAFILNESAVAAMNLDEPVGSEIDFGCWTTGKVIGVVKNFHFQSMHSKIRPLIIVNNLWGAQHLLVKFHLEPDQLALNQVEAIWKEVNPQSPFSYLLLEHTTENMYRKETRFKNLMVSCSIIALILSAIGLFGVILMHAQKRIKEIGIRKVNGAKIFDIIKMLNSAFVKWIAIAFFIASPIAYYAMNKWLQSFAYKTALNWWIFALAGVLALVVALVTVSWQTIRAARRNPVEALRYE